MINRNRKLKKKKRKIMSLETGATWGLAESLYRNGLEKYESEYVCE